MLPEPLPGRRPAATLARRAGVLVPLTVLSAAWTLSVAAVGGAQVPIAAEGPESPAAITVPDAPVDAPASVSAPAGHAVRPFTSLAVPAAAVADAIPAVALAAYQRAEAIIEGADPSCHLAWPLLAAIGRIESDHGRFGGGQLDADGAARPKLVGVALDGTRGTTLVSDTDAGRYDGDKQFDRAVGPLQFIPTTWGVVGVDADNDGSRDPQDIDDAALAAAVYLCSGGDDLRQASGMQRAVLRYNHSATYADSVLTIAERYSANHFAPMPAGLAVFPEGARVAGGTAAREGRGGTVRGIRAAAQPAPVQHPTPRPGGSKPSSGGAKGDVDGGEAPPAPKPTAAPSVPLAETLGCTLASLDTLLQPDALTTCLAKLGQ